jgi:dephospho-CoA kinase
LRSDENEWKTQPTDITGFLRAVGPEVIIFCGPGRDRVLHRAPLSAEGHLFRVALTGNIASGKSAVAEEWARQGAPIIDSDDLARVAVEPGSPGLDRVRSEFGEGVIAGDGTLDRAAMRSIVFADDGKRIALERILHPEIARLRDESEEVLRNAGRTIVAHVIPLLFEVGMQGEFDAIVLVDSPAEIRLERLVRIRGLDADEAKAMIRAQMPAEQKKAIMKAMPALTRVIDNDGTLDDLRERAREAWLTLKHAVRTERADP